MKILMIGYYGYRNFGDDLFVKMFTSYLSKKDFIEKIFIICKDDYYPKNDPKLRFFKADKLSQIQRFSLLLQADAMIWGGRHTEFE